MSALFFLRDGAFVRSTMASASTSTSTADFDFDFDFCFDWRLPFEPLLTRPVNALHLHIHEQRLVDHALVEEHKVESPLPREGRRLWPDLRRQRGNKSSSC